MCSIHMRAAQACCGGRSLTGLQQRRIIRHWTMRKRSRRQSCFMPSPDTVMRSCEKNEPYLITRHVIELAKAMNRFYYEHRIIDEDTAKTAARLELAACVKQVIKTGLYLIGVGAPERM